MPSPNWEPPAEPCLPQEMPWSLFPSPRIPEVRLDSGLLPPLPASQSLAIPLSYRKVCEAFQMSQTATLVVPILLHIFLPFPDLLECACLSQDILKCTFGTQSATCMWWHFFNTSGPTGLKLSTRRWNQDRETETVMSQETDKCPWDWGKALSGTLSRVSSREWSM